MNLLPSNNNLFSSYNGKHANIIYTVRASADIAKRLDVNKEEGFSVFNSNNNKVVLHNGNPSSINEDNIKTSITTNTIESENNFSQSSNIEAKEEDMTKESYSARFERIFGKRSNRTSASNRHPRHRYFTSSGTTVI